MAPEAPPPDSGLLSGLPSFSSRVILVALAIVLGCLSYFIFRGDRAPAPSNSSTALSPSIPGPATPETQDRTQSAIRLYRLRVAKDAEDARSQNALAELYLQVVRETGNEDYLPLARRAATASLAAVPYLRNEGGLLASAHADFSNHDFQKARDQAMQLIQLDPQKSEPYAVLGEARLELGNYEGAEQAYRKMQEFAENNPGVETRLARLAFLHGATEEAEGHLQSALSLLRTMSDPSPETIAWCQWQLGETAFATGDYQKADRYYREALTTMPGYFRALSSLGKELAARGDSPGAIRCYEQVVRSVPALPFMAALGDLYRLAGREREASVQFELAEEMGDHSRKVHGSAFDRNLALYYCDHDMRLEKAYDLAQREYQAGRHDIYGADALAWAAFKTGRLTEAKSAIKEALRLGTLDAKLYYHAGMIALGSGDKAAGHDLLRRALELSPCFDPLQSAVAQKALQE